MSSHIYLNAKQLLESDIEFLKAKLDRIPALLIIYSKYNDNSRSFAMSVDRLCNQHDIPTIMYRTEQFNANEGSMFKPILDEGLPLLIINPLETNIDLSIYQDLDVVQRKNKLIGEFAYDEESGLLLSLFPAVAQAVLLLIRGFADAPMDYSEPLSVYINNESLNVGLPLASSLFIYGFGAYNTIGTESADNINVIVSATGKDKTSDITTLFKNLDDKLIIDVGSRIVDGKLVGDIDNKTLEDKLGTAHQYVSPKEVGTLTSLIVIQRFLERLQASAIIKNMKDVAYTPPHGLC